MAFEPVKMQRRIFKTEDAERPYVIELTPLPSKEWVEKFGFYTFPRLFPGNAYPTIVEWGIAIPELSRAKADDILSDLAVAVDAVNQDEARRVEQLMPDTQTLYEQWFDSRSDQS
jgi:hypothetical protein